jgi:crotonobetainyl-CoA:carnitine CoA-transferase CaiB-like acyl-CoA transferase
VRDLLIESSKTSKSSRPILAHREESSEVFPLSGTRVVEKTSGIAGPLCGKLLADAGATVTSVKLASSGTALESAISRDWQEFLNLGKDVVSVDATLPDGRALIDDLLAEADLYLTSARHEPERERGLDCHSVLDCFPQLVAACVTPFGQAGPYSHFVGDDVVLSALCGLADATPGIPDHREHADDPPVQSLAPLAEIGGGLIAANAVFGAMAGRGARPHHVEVASIEAAASLMVWEWGMAAYGGGIRGRRPIPVDLAPNCYLRCRDGYVVLVAFTDAHWRGLVEVMGNPTWASEPEYETALSRAAHWPTLKAHLVSWVSERRGLEILEAAQSRGIPCCCSYELRDTVTSEHVRQTESFRRLGDRLYPADPIVVNGERRAAPRTRTAADPVGPVPDTQAAVEQGGQPLTGVRVLDLGQVVAGPYAGQLLAALGAEVILIESRAHPVSRMFGPFIGEPKHDGAMMFHQVNRGKDSVELDLTTEAGSRVLIELVKSADVVVENFSRRAAERLGVTYERLRRAREDIILASISGFGRSGPWGDYVALHSGVILLSGLASITLDELGEMRLAGAIYPDLLAGAYLALAVQEALAARETSRAGCRIEVAMLDVLLTAMAGLIPTAAQAGKFEPHPGRFVRTSEPGRFLAVSDARASAEEFANRTRQEAMTALQERGIRAGAVLDIAEVIEDPHLVARNFVVRGDHPLAGPRPMPAVPWLYDGTRPKLRHAPLLGNQTDVVMTEIAHLSAHELASLREQKVLA